MYVGSPFVANAQTPELKQPRKGSFYHPPPSAQSASMFGVALREPRHDPAGTQTSPDCLRVIATVAQHTIRTMARSPSLALQGWNGINQCEGLLRIVTIRARERDGERNTTTVTNQMTLAAKLGPIGGIGTCLLPQKLLELNCRPQLLVTNQFCRSERANPRARSGSIATAPPLANHASVASRSCRSHTSVLEGAFPKECRYATRIECPPDTFCLPNGVCHPWALPSG